MSEFPFLQTKPVSEQPRYAYIVYIGGANGMIPPQYITAEAVYAYDNMVEVVARDGTVVAKFAGMPWLMLDRDLVDLVPREQYLTESKEAQHKDEEVLRGVYTRLHPEGQRCKDIAGNGGGQYL